MPANPGNPMSGCGLEDGRKSNVEVPRGCEKRRGGWPETLVWFTAKWKHFDYIEI